jgi:CelD/BcsL family acetyltransferase involved in cellulose biosynthesis
MASQPKGEPVVWTRLGWPDVMATADAWETVRAGAPTESLFLTPEWLVAWWRHLRPRGAGRRPLLLAASAGADLRAIAPFYRAPTPGGLTVLRPLGAGVSDYLDLLLPVEAKDRLGCLGALLGELVSRSRGWDVLDLPSVPAESPTVAALSELAGRRGLPYAALPGHVRPGIALEGTWDAYLRSRPGKFRYNLRSRLRRLGGLGQVAFRTVASVEDVGEALVRLQGLHARRWADQHTSTIFSSSVRGRAFYLDACRRHAVRGMLDLTLLEVGGRAVAGSVGFVDRDTYYYYLPAWDPDLAPYAPSSLLLAHLVERAYERGLRRFDFMLGDEPYKAQWATEERHTVRLVLGAPGSRGRAAAGALIAWHRLRERARRSPLLRRVRRYGLGRARTALRLHS